MVKRGGETAGGERTENPRASVLWGWDREIASGALFLPDQWLFLIQET